MIESIELQNFQSHKNTKIYFSPGVTSIIGSSDSGKTVILRGIKKVAKNKPGGDAFRSNWGGDTLIKIETDDKASVTRLVTDSKNEYYLDTPNSTDKFKAFGQGVPAEISEALNMDDENIQAQMDAPFLFSSSDGEVARRLNEAANLEKIDNSQSFLIKQIKDIKADIKKGRIDLKDKKAESTDLEFIKAADDLLRDLEEMKKEAEESETAIVQLTSIILDLQQAEESQSGLLFLSAARQGYMNLWQYWEDGFENGKKAGTLSDLLEDIKEIGINLANIPNINKAKQELEEISKDAEGVVKEEFKISSIIDLIDDWLLTDDMGEEWKIKINKYQKQFDKLMPEVCPLCEK